MWQSEIEALDVSVCHWQCSVWVRPEAIVSSTAGCQLRRPSARLGRRELERALEELATEADGLDEADRRQMGRLMGKVCKVARMPVEGPMAEAIRRLESVEGPHKIEEDLGDKLNQVEPPWLTDQTAQKKQRKKANGQQDPKNALARSSRNLLRVVNCNLKSGKHFHPGNHVLFPWWERPVWSQPNRVSGPRSASNFPAVSTAKRKNFCVLIRAPSGFC